jgi:urease accessory protein
MWSDLVPSSQEQQARVGVSQWRNDTATHEAALRFPHPFTTYLDESLAQRPAGSTGKGGKCILTFAAEQGQTRLRHSFVTHPFHLTRPWYLDPALPGMTVVYVQTPAGGLIQGDRTSLRFVLGPEAQVHLTNQAAEKIHTMTANCALQQIVFVLGPRAYAEYLPEPIILFPGARFAQHLQVELGTEARFFFAELFVSHRPAGCSSFHALATSLSVRNSQENLLLQDRSLVFPAQQDLAGPGILGPYHVWGQALLIGPVVPPAWAQEIHALLSEEPAVVCGATVLPGGSGISVKVVGSEVRAVRRVLHTAWHALRTRSLGVPAFVFPK